jgi:pimeloyl-ACP methyl ester carboxylesterase
MNPKSEIPTTSVTHPASGKEGHMPVPGGLLHYRVAGPESAKDVVVFENGWSASFPYAVWFEQALASNVRVVSYDRAGVGDSKSSEPLTTARITEQLMALLEGLGISQPIVVVGHSYGGLIAALHVAQAPGRIRALVQVDPTPELKNSDIDAALHRMLKAMSLMKLLMWAMGGLLFSAYKELPADAFNRITRNRSWMIRSLNGSIPELKLFSEIRRVIESSEEATQCPRLVISAAPAIKRPNALVRLLYSEEKLRKGMEGVRALHRRQAQQNETSRWMSLPCSHVSLITNHSSAAEVARSALEFMRTVVANFRGGIQRDPEAGILKGGRTPGASGQITFV